MPKETNTNIQKTYIQAIALVLIAFFIFEPFKSEMKNVNQNSSIQTSGSCQMEMTSDTASVIFTIKNDSKKLQTAVNKTQESYTKLVDALIKNGFKETELSTIGYDVEEQKYWDSKVRKSVLENYTAKMSIKLTTTDIKNIETAMQISTEFNDILAGDFSTSLSDTAYKKAYESCLETAAQNARDKAEKIANGSGRSLGKPISLRETKNNIEFRDNILTARSMMAKMEMAPQIMKSNTKINVEITASFEVK